MESVNSAAPFEEKRIRGFSLPWLNLDLRKLIRTRNRLKKRAQNAKTGEEKYPYMQNTNYLETK